MTVNTSLFIRNHVGDFVVDYIDHGSVVANGYMQIRTGPRPASLEDAATGVVLATLKFAATAFGNFSNGIAYANPIASDTSTPASGTASYFRIFNKDNEAVIDGDVSEIGGGGDIQFDNIDFVAGGVVAINTLTATVQ